MQKCRNLLPFATPYYTPPAVVDMDSSSPPQPEIVPTETLDLPPATSPKGLFFVASDLDLESEAFTLVSPQSEECDGWHSANEAEHSSNGAGLDEYLDLEELQFLSVEGVDKQGRKILRIIGKFLPATIIDSTRLKEYVLQKIRRDLADEPFCVVYFHTCVKRKENNPGMFTLRWIYETLPQQFRQLLDAVYFVHPGLLSRTILGTLGRFLLSDGLYRKLNYINRIEFLWDHMKKTQIEVPDFVYEHDEELEHRPLMDYGLEADPLHNYGAQGFDSTFARHPLRWAP